MGKREARNPLRAARLTIGLRSRQQALASRLAVQREPTADLARPLARLRRTRRSESRSLSSTSSWRRRGASPSSVPARGRSPRSARSNGAQFVPLRGQHGARRARRATRPNASCPSHQVSFPRCSPAFRGARVRSSFRFGDRAPAAVYVSAAGLDRRTVNNHGIRYTSSED